MDRSTFERTLLDLGFVKQVAPKDPKRGRTMMPESFTFKPKPNVPCGVKENMACGSRKQITYFDTHRRVTCAGCRNTWHIALNKNES
jgi:hypothetical protein